LYRIQKQNLKTNPKKEERKVKMSESPEKNIVQSVNSVKKASNKVAPVKEEVKKIDKLTPEQEAMLPKWRDEWIAKGLRTTPINPDEARKICVNIFTQFIDKPAPKRLLIKESPYSCWDAVCLAAHNCLPADDKAPLVVKPEQKLSFVWPYIDGHWSASYIGHYEFFRQVLGLKFPEKWQYFADTINIGPMFILADLDTCIVCDFPRIIKKNERGLHSQTGPAVKFADGWSLWALNGVIVPKDVIETKPEDMNSEFLQKYFIAERNVEVRREVVRKAGMTRLCSVLKTQMIDKDGDYELLLIDIGEGNMRPFLKMKNPSTGDTHVEDVAPDIKTVKDANIWRAGIEKKTLDDKKGKEWFQQGDVILLPEGEEILKPKPTVLT